MHLFRILIVLFVCCKGELEDSVKLLVKVIRKASVVNSGLNFEVFLHKIDGIAEYERVDLLDGVSKLQKELFLEAEMGDINLRSVLLLVDELTQEVNYKTEWIS